MARVIVNGKAVNVPNSASDQDIIRASGRNFNPNTRKVVKNTNAASRDIFKPGLKYNIKDGEKFSIVPDRVKATNFSYFGHKEEWQKRVIEDQVIDVSAKMFKNSPVELDEDCNYVVFKRFLLPQAWQDANPGITFVKMMLIFPDQYPELPTNGFYLPSTLQTPPSQGWKGHFHEQGYGGAFGQDGHYDEIAFMRQGNWKWFCTHIKPEAWQPAPIRKIADWRKGDSLWDILTLCTEVLTHPLDD